MVDAHARDGSRKRNVSRGILRDKELDTRFNLYYYTTGHTFFSKYTTFVPGCLKTVWYAVPFFWTGITF